MGSARHAKDVLLAQFTPQRLRNTLKVKKVQRRLAMEGTLIVFLLTVLRLVVPVAALLFIGEIVRRRETRRNA